MAGIIAVACRNSTGPQADVVQVVGTDSIVAQGFVIADDTVDRVGCVDLLRLVFTIAPDSAILDSAVITYLDPNNAPIGVQHLSADTLAALGFALHFHAGGYDAANTLYYNVAPFTAQMHFYYTEITTGHHGAAPFVLRCAALGPELNGRYALQRIDNTPLPTGDNIWTTIYYDTLDFAFPNMAYVQIDKYQDGAFGPYTVVGGFNAYEIASPDTFSFPYVTKGEGPGAGYVHGDTLTILGGNNPDSTAGYRYTFTLVPGSTSMTRLGSHSGHAALMGVEPAAHAAAYAGRARQAPLPTHARSRL